MKLQIKNMVCNRCIMAVQNILAKLEFGTFKVSMGLIEIDEFEFNDEKEEVFVDKLNQLGFDIIIDNNFTSWNYFRIIKSKTN